MRAFANALEDELALLVGRFDRVTIEREANTLDRLPVREHLPGNGHLRREEPLLHLVPGWSDNPYEKGGEDRHGNRNHDLRRKEGRVPLTSTRLRCARAVLPRIDVSTRFQPPGL